MSEPPEDQKVMASPDGAFSFLMGIFALLIWYTSIHRPSSSELLTAAGLWLVLSTGAVAAALFNMARGKMRGNLNLLATLLLGFFPGLNAAVSLVARIAGFSYTPKVVGLVYIIGSLFCAGMVFVRLDRPAYRSLGTLAISLGLFFLGLGDALSLQILRTIGGWCMFAFALYIFYFGLSIMYLLMGSSLPQGPVLRHGKSMSAYENKLDEEQKFAAPAHLQNFTSPLMILSFISAVFGLLNFVSAVFTMSLDEELAMGLIRLLLGSIHFLAALVILFQGNAYGNITLIFSVCFALFSGSRKVMMVLEQAMPVSTASGLYGILQLCAGLYVLAFLPAIKNMPLYSFCSYVLSALGLTLFGLSELCSIGWMSQMAGWMFLIFTFLHVYKGLSAMLPQLPQGVIWRAD